MKRIIRIALVLAVPWLLGVAAWIAAGPPEKSSDRADIAIVLGAAISDEEPSPVFRARIDHAIGLYKSGRVARIGFTGGQASDDSSSEADVARAYAIWQDVDADDILIETESRTTRQNLIEAKRYMTENGVEDALIVSDPFHLQRAIAMADDLGIVAEASATTTTRYQSLSTKMPFLLRETYFIHHYWLFGE